MLTLRVCGLQTFCMLTLALLFKCYHDHVNVNMVGDIQYVDVLISAAARFQTSEILHTPPIFSAILGGFYVGFFVLFFGKRTKLIRHLNNRNRNNRNIVKKLVTRNEQHRYARTTSPVLLRISLVFLLKAGSPVQNCGRLPVQNQNNWVDEINTAIQGDVSRITEISQ